MEVFEKEDVKATAIGKLTTERRLQLNFNGETVADMDMSFLFTPCKSMKIATLEKQIFAEPQFPEPLDLTETLMQLLLRQTLRAKKASYALTIMK